MKHAFLTLILAVALSGAVAQAQAPATLDVARLTDKGKLHRPADLESWVFLGTSLGMGYNPGSFNAARPGQFQVVLMEPKAYEHFQKTGSYALGSMFVLAFYDSDRQLRSNNQQGFTQADMTNFEIHLLRTLAGEEKHGFYMFGAKDKEGSPMPAGNACVRCHIDHGAFDGTFAQFYPTLRPRLPKELLERASKVKDIH